LHGLHRLSTHHALRTLPCPCRALTESYMSRARPRGNARDCCVERARGALSRCARPSPATRSGRRTSTWSRRR
jgi:hypothetical protein